MELRGLQTLVEVVRSGGFSRASSVLHSTQSTVSKAIQQLEHDLGVVLLERTSRSVRLTPAGEIVHRRALAMLALRDDLTAELDELRGLRRGTLRVGLPSVGGALFVAALKEFRRRYPGVELHLVEHGAKKLERLLLDSELDIGAVLLPASDDLAWRGVANEPFHVLLPAAHRLAARKTVSLTELAAAPFVLFEAGFATNALVLDACKRVGATPTVAARTAQVDFLYELVAAEVGIGFLPRIVTAQRSERRVKTVPVSDEGLAWHLALAWRRDRELPHAARAWLAVMFGDRGDKPASTRKL